MAGEFSGQQGGQSSFLSSLLPLLFIFIFLFCFNFMSLFEPNRRHMLGSTISNAQESSSFAASFQSLLILMATANVKSLPWRYLGALSNAQALWRWEKACLLGHTVPTSTFPGIPGFPSSVYLKINSRLPRDSSLILSKSARHIFVFGHLNTF